RFQGAITSQGTLVLGPLVPVLSSRSRRRTLDLLIWGRSGRAGRRTTIAVRLGPCNFDEVVGPLAPAQQHEAPVHEVVGTHLAVDRSRLTVHVDAALLELATGVALRL